MGLIDALQAFAAAIHNPDAGRSDSGAGEDDRPTPPAGPVPPASTAQPPLAAEIRRLLIDAYGMYRGELGPWKVLGVAVLAGLATTESRTNPVQILAGAAVGGVAAYVAIRWRLTRQAIARGSIQPDQI